MMAKCIAFVVVLALISSSEGLKLEQKVKKAKKLGKVSHLFFNVFDENDDGRLDEDELYLHADDLSIFGNAYPEIAIPVLDALDNGASIGQSDMMMILEAANALGMTRDLVTTLSTMIMNDNLEENGDELIDREIESICETMAIEIDRTCFPDEDEGERMCPDCVHQILAAQGNQEACMTNLIQNAQAVDDITYENLFLSLDPYALCVPQMELAAENTEVGTRCLKKATAVDDACFPNNGEVDCVECRAAIESTKNVHGPCLDEYAFLGVTFGEIFSSLDADDICPMSVCEIAAEEVEDACFSDEGPVCPDCKKAIFQAKKIVHDTCLKDSLYAGYTYADVFGTLQMEELCPVSEERSDCETWMMFIGYKCFMKDLQCPMCAEVTESATTELADLECMDEKLPEFKNMTYSQVFDALALAVGDECEEEEKQEIKEYDEADAPAPAPAPAAGLFLDESFNEVYVSHPLNFEQVKISMATDHKFQSQAAFCSIHMELIDEACFGPDGPVCPKCDVLVSSLEPILELRNSCMDARAPNTMVSYHLVFTDLVSHQYC